MKIPRIRIVTNGKYYGIQREAVLCRTEPRVFKDKRTQENVWVWVGDPYSEQALTSSGSGSGYFDYNIFFRKLYKSEREAKFAVEILKTNFERQQGLKEWKEVKVYD